MSVLVKSLQAFPQLAFLFPVGVETGPLLSASSGICVTHANQVAMRL